MRFNSIYSKVKDLSIEERSLYEAVSDMFYPFIVDIEMNNGLITIFHIQASTGKYYNRVSVTRELVQQASFDFTSEIKERIHKGFCKAIMEEELKNEEYNTYWMGMKVIPSTILQDGESVLFKSTGDYLHMQRDFYHRSNVYQYKNENKEEWKDVL